MALVATSQVASAAPKDNIEVLDGAALDDPSREPEHEMCVTPAVIESVPVSIACHVVSIGIADGAVRSSND